MKVIKFLEPYSVLKSCVSIAGEVCTSESLVLRECQSGGAYRPIGLSTVLEMVLDILPSTGWTEEWMNRRMDAGQIYVRINRFISMHIVGFIIQNKFSIDKFQLDEGWIQYWLRWWVEEINWFSSFVLSFYDYKKRSFIFCFRLC